MQILLGYFLFSVLLRTGAAFQCITCNKNALTCTSELQSCSAGQDSCLKSLSEVVQGEKTENNVQIGCATSSLCKNDFIELSYQKGVYVRRKYDCCKTDGCTPSSKEMPSLNITTNGLHCPVCSLETGLCPDDVTLDCTGSATYCFEARIKEDKNRPIKGCTTESVCNILKTYEGPIVETAPIQNVNCQQAKDNSGGAPSGVTCGSFSSLAAFLAALLPLMLFHFTAY